MAVQTKTSRIDLRLIPDDKTTLEKAAEINRMNLSAYITKVAIESARMDIEREKNIVLSNKARDMLLDLLENPPEPNEALRKLFQ